MTYFRALMDGLILPDSLAWSTFLVGALAAACCGVVGYFLVLRGLSLLGDGISHAVLPGIVLAYLIFSSRGSFVVYAGAAAAGLAVAVATQSLVQSRRVAEDAGLGIVFTSFFALGLVLLQLFARNVDIDAGCVLFGLLDFAALDSVSLFEWEVPRAARQLSITLAALLLLTALGWKELRISSFDEEFAAALGFRPSLIHFGLMAVTAIVCVSCFESVGSILVVAMLVAPAASAQLLSDAMFTQFLLTLVMAVASAYFGVLAAAHWGISTPGAISTASGALFIVSLIGAPKYGLIARTLRAWWLGVRIVSEDLLTRLYRLQETGQAGEPVAALVEGVRDVRAPWVLRFLSWKGMIRVHQGAASLTPLGEKEAVVTLRSHRLWEVYLSENFALPDDHLHDAAERFEHFTGPSLQAELERAVDSPTIDPHGKQIPEPPSDAKPVPRDEASGV